jgi:ATP-dependent Clp protease ATP-binding subunit ClpC
MLYAQKLEKFRHQLIKTNDMQNEKPFLDRLTIDLTNLAEEGKLDPVVARDHEIKQLTEILNISFPRNPLLVGERGVGKTSIVEGLAQRIANASVPGLFAKKRILQLDMSALVGGAGGRTPVRTGERLRRLTEEIIASEAILFIQWISELFLMEVFTEEVRVSTFLSPAIELKQISCIGTLTPTDFIKFKAVETKLAECFQPIYITELSLHDTVKVLHAHKSLYEKFHRLTITDEAISEAVRLSVQYMPEQVLPARALDLMDEAAAMLRKSSEIVEKQNEPQEIVLTAQHIADLIASRQ